MPVNVAFKFSYILGLHSSNIKLVACALNFTFSGHTTFVRLLQYLNIEPTSINCSKLILLKLTLSSLLQPINKPAKLSTDSSISTNSNPSTLKRCSPHLLNS